MVQKVEESTTAPRRALSSFRHILMTTCLHNCLCVNTL